MTASPRYPRTPSYSTPSSVGDWADHGPMNPAPPGRLTEPRHVLQALIEEGGGLASSFSTASASTSKGSKLTSAPSCEVSRRRHQLHAADNHRAVPRGAGSASKPFTGMIGVRVAVVWAIRAPNDATETSATALSACTGGYRRLGNRRLSQRAVTGASGTAYWIGVPSTIVS